MYVSIGSRSNVSDDAREADRARIFEFNPDGSGRKVYAWGIRNAVGIAFRPGSDELWMSTNERDEIGEDLPPDYVSSVRPGGFYGWPWFYIGNHVDPRHKGKHPELADKVIVPDVLVEAHSATPQFVLLHRRPVSGRIQRRHFRRFPRFVEPKETHWLQNCSRPLRPLNRESTW